MRCTCSELSLGAHFPDILESDTNPALCAHHDCESGIRTVPFRSSTVPRSIKTTRYPHEERYTFRMYKVASISVGLLILVGGALAYFYISMSDATEPVAVEEPAPQEPSEERVVTSKPEVVPAAPEPAKVAPKEKSEKDLIIEVLVARQKLFESGDLSKIKPYMLLAISSAEAKEQLEQMSDEEWDRVLEFVTAMPITYDTLTQQSTEWDISGNLAKVKIHSSDSESVTVEARKIDGVWY